MEKQFIQIQPKEIDKNIIKLVGEDWLLITAGDEDQSGRYNSMTACWGGMGVMWGKEVTFILVRNERHTFKFMEESKYYTLSFYAQKYRPLLNDVFGQQSGRDIDKAKVSGFTPIDTGYGIAYAEAELIISCHKIYGTELSEGNAIPELSKEWYFNGSPTFHKLYFGEIVAAWQKKQS